MCPGQHDSYSSPVRRKALSIPRSSQAAVTSYSAKGTCEAQVSKPTQQEQHNHEI